MDQKLEEFILKFPRQIIMNIMESALDYMEQFNGRSINDCILLALEAETYNVDFGDVDYILPSYAQVKDDFDY